MAANSNGKEVATCADFVVAALWLIVTALILYRSSAPVQSASAAPKPELTRSRGSGRSFVRGNHPKPRAEGQRG